jgi:hypothetical protein
MSALRIFTLVFVGLFGLVLLITTSNAANQLPKTEYTFNKVIEENDAFSIYTDPVAAHKVLDADGDTLSAGVFLIKTKKPIGEQQTTFFVNVVIGVCGYDGIILLSSKQYNQQHDLISDTQPMLLFPSEKGTPSDFIYKHLCPFNYKPGIKGLII